MDLIGPMIDVITFIGRPARKYLKYHRKFNEYVDNFRRVQAGLIDRKADIQQKLQEELHLGKMPKREVESWFRKVEEKINQAQGVEDKVSKGKYLLHSCLGKLVDETTQAMKEVYAEGHFADSLVVDDPSTTRVKLPTTELAGAGATTRTEEIYEYLMGGEVRMIGVCGMGGIGKTTLMKHVHNSLLKEAKFNKLIWTTVSQDFDVRRLQKDIASQLNENLSDHENTTIRAAKLSEMLRKQGSYVLILDDVWSSFFLEDVGIPEPTTDNGCKLVLTTRSEEVVRSMECTKVQVACLSMDEAFKLFLSIIGQNMLGDQTLESTMKLIVRECDGLPLAIVTVAGCMRGISDPLLWKNALTELRGYIRNIPDMERKVFGCLMFSYDHLEQKDQSCFLCCALYPEDYRIPKEEIIDHWIEEGLIDEMESRGAMTSNGHAVLQRLEENCLVERVENGLFIKMHDLVRDMASHITRKRFLVKAGIQLKELPNEEEWIEDLEKVSLMYNFISTIPPNMKSPKCPKLTTLLLSKNSLKQIPESFFDHMPNLKILDLSKNPIVNLPNSVSNVENLTTLLLRDCYNLGNLPSLLKLQALKKLDLGCSSIKEIPQGLEMLVNLRFLNLGFTRCLKEIPNGLLSKLCRLQYLAIHPASTRGEDVRKLNKLEVFEGCVTNVHDLNMYAGQRKKLHKYLIWVSQELIDWRFNFSSNYSKMVAFRRFDINSEDAILLPSDIQQLKVHDCKGMRSLNDIRGLKDATDLKKCAIRDCDELEFIFSPSCQLQTLESLHLQDLTKLKAMVGESSVGTFSSLKKIFLSDCGQIKNVFSANWPLHNLETISVRHCEKMEELIVSEGEGMATNTTTKYVLPKLRTLELKKLPELKSICGRNEVIVCDSIQHIHIKFCPKLKRIPLHLPLLEPDKGKPFPRLMEISVDSKEWWESLEWDNPNAKNVLEPYSRRA